MSETDFACRPVCLSDSVTYHQGSVLTQGWCRPKGCVSPSVRDREAETKALRRAPEIKPTADTAKNLFSVGTGPSWGVREEFRSESSFKWNEQTFAHSTFVKSYSRNAFPKHARWRANVWEPLARPFHFRYFLIPFFSCFVRHPNLLHAAADGAELKTGNMSQVTQGKSAFFFDMLAFWIQPHYSESCNHANIWQHYCTSHAFQISMQHQFYG